jgi:uncharacterized protein (TIGR00251 family)
MPRLTIKVTPNAKQSEILGAVEIAGGEKALAVKLKAPPVDGKANEALIAFLAGHFDVPKRAVTIVRGAKDRLKVVEIDGIPDDRLSELME